MFAPYRLASRSPLRSLLSRCGGVAVSALLDRQIRIVALDRGHRAIHGLADAASGTRPLACRIVLKLAHGNLRSLGFRARPSESGCGIGRESDGTIMGHGCRASWTALFGSIPVLVGLIAGSEPLSAQDVGERVRVTIGDGVASTGQLQGMAEESIDLLLGDGPTGSIRSFARSEIVLLERSLGTTRQWKRGLLWGGAGGFAAGLVKGLVSGYDTCPGLCFYPEQLEHHEGLYPALVYGMGFGALGAFWGGGIGALIRREEWETIPHATPNGFALSPVLDVRPGRDEGSTTYLGIRVRF